MQRSFWGLWALLIASAVACSPATDPDVSSADSVGASLNASRDETATRMPSPPQLIDLEAFESAHVASRNLTIWLPPGYEDGTRAYPVIYFHDGQNLFRPGFSYAGEEWGVDEAMTELVAEGEIEPAIIVGIWNTPLRAREYGPQALFEALPEAEQAGVAGYWGGAALSDAYLRFIVEELKPHIDTTYRTRQEAASTFLMGSSMGGLISLYGLAEYPDVFGGAAAVSTHWPLAVLHDWEDGQAAEAWFQTVLPVWQDYLSDARLDASRHRLWMDHGTADLDGLYPPYQRALESDFAALGFVEGSDFTVRVYPDAPHNEVAWRARVKEPLRFLLPNSPELD